MSRDLFDTVAHAPTPVGSRSGVTLSLLVHALTLAAIVVIPLVATDVLPVPDRAIRLIVVRPDVPPEPPRPDGPTPRRDPAAATSIPIALEPPPQISPEPATRPPVDLGEIPRDDRASFGATHRDGTGGDGVVMGLAAPPTPPPASVPAREPVRVGGAVTAPAKVFDVAPAYPVIARSAGIEGTVILQATIGIDGRVEDLRVLRSVPLLDEAARTAVRQWRYTPTRLNGDVVAVIMTVTVTFHLR